jgi:hypothetical protein
MYDLLLLFCITLGCVAFVIICSCCLFGRFNKCRLCVYIDNCCQRNILCQLLMKQQPLSPHNYREADIFDANERPIIMDLENQK